MFKLYNTIQYLQYLTPLKYVDSHCTNNLKMIDNYTDSIKESKTTSTLDDDIIKITTKNVPLLLILYLSLLLVRLATQSVSVYFERKQKIKNPLQTSFASSSCQPGVYCCAPASQLLCRFTPSLIHKLPCSFEAYCT